MIILSSFIYVALLHSTFAKVSMPRSQGWSTMAAAWLWRPPWLGCFFSLSPLKITDSYINMVGRLRGKFPLFAAGEVSEFGEFSFRRLLLLFFFLNNILFSKIS